MRAPQVRVALVICLLQSAGGLAGGFDEVWLWACTVSSIRLGPWLKRIGSWTLLQWVSPLPGG